MSECVFVDRADIIIRRGTTTPLTMVVVMHTYTGVERTITIFIIIFFSLEVEKREEKMGLVSV